MRSSRKLAILAACAVLAGCVFSNASAAEKEVKTTKQDKKKESAKKKEKDEKKTADRKGVTDDGKGKMALPLIEGHDAKGLKIPYFGAAGQIQMVFTIGVASRLDSDRVQMGELQVETFDEAGEREMTIDLPNSVLDLNTRVITTTTNVTIRRDDFQITGEKMQFNTQTKQGQLAGNVRMLIYDPDEKNANAPTPAVQPQEPIRE